MAWQDREKEWGNLQAVQAKVGEISMIWAAIDRSLDRLLTDLLDISPAQTAALVTGQLPSKKCQTIRKLIVLGSPSEEWTTEVDSILREISEGFGEQRNRIVHDAWSFEIDKIGRVDARAKLTKKPFQGKGIEYDTEHKVTLADLATWCERGYEISARLSELQPALLPWLLYGRAQLSD